jgi:hypothetical protein
MAAQRILITAISGTGRKNIMLRKFMTDQAYDTVSVLSTIWNPVYDAISNGKTYRSEAELPKLESFDRTKKHLVVIHLWNCDKIPKLDEFWERAASYGITCIYITLSYYYNVPRKMRRNCDIVCMYREKPTETDAMSLRKERPDLSLSQEIRGWQIWR